MKAIAVSKQEVVIKELDRIISKWQKILRLEDYTFHLRLRDPIDGNVLARIERYPYRKEGIIWFNPRLHRKVKQEMESTIIHELIHAKLWGMSCLMGKIIKSVDSIEKAKIFAELAKEKEEKFVYDFEKVLYKLGNPKRVNPLKVKADLEHPK